MKSKLPAVFRNILKGSEYPQKMKILKATFCWITVLLFEKMCFLN